MVIKFIPAAFGIALIVFLVACSGQPSEKEGRESQLPAPVAVEVSPVMVRDITEGINTVGTLSPKFQADVKSEYPGIVAQVYVTEWQQVRKGDPLARLDTREADILVRKAEVEGQKAEREYERMLKLNEAGLVTQQNLDDARTARDAMEEMVRHARTRLGKAEIVSPLDGVVALRMINVGDLVGEVGSPKIMFRIVDNRILDLTCTVPSIYLKDIRPGQAIDFRSDAFPGQTFPGVVDFINPVINEADRSIKVVALVNNENGLLKGGLFVNCFIKTAFRTGVMQVPKTALLKWDMAGRKADLFVARDGKARLCSIATGYAEQDRIEVTSGLDPSAQVILRGNFQLKDGDPIVIVSSATDTPGN
ncbi:MAG: efflux RND transporter periplasmic adaptor subunit [Thermodesulfobacteriota bacterium]